jgi:cytochrome c oxidase subunit 3
MGMWLFLVTELLLFGGMFLLYSVYRAKHPGEFHDAAMQLNTLVGTANTIILLTSSLAMALSISAAHQGRKKAAMVFLLFTILLGLAFLVNKYFEWGAKIHHGIYPRSPELLKRSFGEVLFFGLYYAMTGLHGLHVFVGVVILSIMAVSLPSMPRRRVSLRGEVVDKLKGARMTARTPGGEEVWDGGEMSDSLRRVDIDFKYEPAPGRAGIEEYSKLEVAGLYWHLVDIIWIFLFPLFYLIT